MIFLLCLLTRVLSEKELAKLHGEWMRLLLKQEGGGSCALFIHFEHSWQPAWALMQRERERNRKWWCYVSLFFPQPVLWSWVYCQYSCSWGSLGSRGWGRGRQEGDEWRERFFALNPTEQGKCSFVSGTACIAFHTPLYFFTNPLLFMESVVKLPGNPSAVKPGQQDREGWYLSSANSSTPSTLLPRNRGSESVQPRVTF